MKWLGVLMLLVAVYSAYGVYKDKNLGAATVAVFYMAALTAWVICAIFLIAHGRLR